MRHVCGTMRSYPSRAVLTVLQRLTTLAKKVELCRKFKKGDSRVQWWFLIHADKGFSTAGARIRTCTDTNILEAGMMPQTSSRPESSRI